MHLKELFQFDNKITATHNPIRYALQIRDYVAYVNEKLNYENFKKHEKDFYVNDELSKEEKLKDINKIDNETSLKLSDYQLRTAGIYLMPNGGITIRDAWNSAIVMEGGNIYLQPAKDMVTQPLRSVIVKAGKNINMSCRDHIDFSSSEEGMRIKTHKSQYLYSHDGGIVLESKTKKDAPYTPQPKDGALRVAGGIILKSKLGIYNYAEKNIVNYAKGRMLFQALKNIDITAEEGGMTIYSQENMMVMSDQSMLMHSKQVASIISDATVILAGKRSTILGEKGQAIPLEGVIETEPLVKRTFDKPRKLKKTLLKQTIFQEPKKFEDLQFKFLKTVDYGGLNEESDPLPITLAQQDNLLTDLYKLEEWEEKEINETYPYPGKDLYEKFYYITEKPANLEKHPDDKDSYNKAKSEPKPTEIKLESLKKYKVLK
jgi:hypothetical protein